MRALWAIRFPIYLLTIPVALVVSHDHGTVGFFAVVAVPFVMRSYARGAGWIR